jgi:hypothetical protein
MKCWMLCKPSGIAAVVVVLALVMSTSIASAMDGNPGVFPIGSTVKGKTYGQWGVSWWQWAVQQAATMHPDKSMTVDNCPGESGRVPMFFLIAPTTHSNCVVPEDTPIMFPTFNVEWSVEEASMSGYPARQTCFVPAKLFGTSYAALLACATATADHLTRSSAGGNSEATVEARVDGRGLQNLEDYRVRSNPPPFMYSAGPGNLFGLTDQDGRSVADGFWIILRPLSPGKHTVQFTASVPFPDAQPPFTPFTFAPRAEYCLVVQPSSQTCP